jgi:hypothetical protein
MGGDGVRARRHQKRDDRRADGGIFVVLARPEGAGPALATFRVPIEGHDEWIAAARHLA